MVCQRAQPLSTFLSYYQFSGTEWIIVLRNLKVKCGICMRVLCSPLHLSASPGWHRKKKKERKRKRKKWVYEGGSYSDIIHGNLDLQQGSCSLLRGSILPLVFPAEQMLNSAEMKGWRLSRSTDEIGISKKVAERRETPVPQPAQRPRCMPHSCDPGRRVLVTGTLCPPAGA